LVEKKYENKATKATLVFVDQCDENYHAEMNEFNNETFEQKIKDVYSDICAQKFEPPTDNSAPCEFCSYRQFCNLNLL